MRYYAHCPECRTRMVRTGQKRWVAEGSNYGRKVDLYEWEYECPNCGKYWLYNVARNWFTPGSFKEG